MGQPESAHMVEAPTPERPIEDYELREILRSGRATFPVVAVDEKTTVAALMEGLDLFEDLGTDLIIPLAVTERDSRSLIVAGPDGPTEVLLEDQAAPASE